MIGNEIFRDERLNLVDRGLLSTLMSLPESWEFTVSGMEAILPDGKDRIKQSLKRLENFGYVTIRQERNSKGEFERNIVEVRSQLTKPSADLPSAENPSTVKRPADNPSKYKNNYSKNNNKNKEQMKRTWNPVSKNKFLNFDQRSYSMEFYEELERKMAGVPGG